MTPVRRTASRRSDSGAACWRVGARMAGRHAPAPTRAPSSCARAAVSRGAPQRSSTSSCRGPPAARRAPALGVEAGGEQQAEQVDRLSRRARCHQQLARDAAGGRLRVVRDHLAAAVGLDREGAHLDARGAGPASRPPRSRPERQSTTRLLDGVRARRGPPPPPITTARRAGRSRRLWRRSTACSRGSCRRARPVPTARWRSARPYAPGVWPRSAASRSRAARTARRCRPRRQELPARCASAGVERRDQPLARGGQLIGERERGEVERRTARRRRRLALGRRKHQQHRTGQPARAPGGASRAARRRSGGERGSARRAVMRRPVRRRRRAPGQQRAGRTADARGRRSRRPARARRRPSRRAAAPARASPRSPAALPRLGRRGRAAPG